MSDIFRQQTARELEEVSRRSPGKRLQWLLDQKGLTARDLRDFLGCQITEVMNIIHGRSVHPETVWVNEQFIDKADVPCVTCRHGHRWHEGPGACKFENCECFRYLPELKVWDPSTLTFEATMNMTDEYCCNCAPGFGTVDEFGVVLCNECGKLMKASTAAEFIRMRKPPFDKVQS